MRIGIDARFFGIAGKGLGRYTEKLILELEKTDTKNTYEIFLTPEGFQKYTPKNKRFSKIQVAYPWYGFAEQLLYPWFLYGRSLDLMHFPHFNVPFLYRKKFIVTIHDLILLHYPTPKASRQSAWWYRIKYFVYKKVIRSAIRRAITVCVVSDFTHKDVETLYPGSHKKIVVTKEGVDQYCLWQRAGAIRQLTEELWQRAKRDDAQRPFALYVGNAYPHKNLNLFLKLAQAEPEKDIVLVGKPDYFYNRFQKEVKGSGLQNIYFVGGVSDTELAALYRTATVYVFPSLYEGFGLPPLEAMQYGLPVLSADTGSLPEILGDAALLASPHVSQDFVRAYKTLWENEERRALLRQKGFQRASGFRWGPMALVTQAVYNSTDQDRDSCYNKDIA